MIHRRRFTSLVAASALAPALPHFAFAQQAFAQQVWPTRFVRIVVPFTPGGGVDTVGRVVGAKLSEMWGQQVIVENKPGAGGNIASEMVARSDPDGTTLYISAAGIAVNQFLFPSVNYDPVNDFAPVSLLCFFPNLLVVPPSSPFKSVGDLLAYARANPGKLNFGSPGHGSSPHMSGELFKYMAKVDITHVPYRGAAPALSDLMAGRVDVMFAVMASGLPLAQSGQLRALAVTTDKRMASAPDVPTIAETGVPGYDSSSWFAFFLPARTPPAIVKKVSADTATVLKDPAVVARLEQLGMVIVGSTPEEMGAYLKADIAKWGPVIKAAGIKVSE
jgi:tripartite-type tricarboxylate transporter receptor subunit TctC